MNGSAFQPGREIGNFLILKSLGKGGMAELFLARDRILKRRVVIKVLALPLSGRTPFQRQFLREARIQANLESPYIVQVLGVLEHEGSHCLVMQYVQGTDLEKVIRKAKSLREKRGEKGALSEKRAIHIFHQVLEGIGFAHRYRIIHGDIKPANVLLDRQGRAKVADFGLAFLLTCDGRAREEMPQGGTPCYMSPEQILNRQVDFRSDIYSLGVTLFHMLTGSFPTGDRKRFMEYVECHLEGSLEGAETVLDEYRDLLHPRTRKAILKAIDNDPDRRHQSCLEFALAVREEGSHETYSELLRSSLLSKREVTLPERAYLDENAEAKSLSPEEALSLEVNIRNEMGLPPLDFRREYKAAMKALFRRGRDPDAARDELGMVYVEKKRVSEKDARKAMDELLLERKPPAPDSLSPP